MKLFYSGVTTMQPTNSLVGRLTQDFPAYTIVSGQDFKWSPAKRQIIYAPLDGPEDEWTLLHELAHADLGHADYILDIQLVQQEVAAWEHAREVLGPRYGHAISEDHIQDHLDSYRQWLHKRSTCPECSQNGLQTTQNTYSCTNCRCLWRVNDARMCRLRRSRLKQLI
jgi:hypothetical protein